MPRTFSFCNIVGDVGVKLVQDKNSWNSLIRILLKIRNRKSSTAAYHYEIQTATFSFVIQETWTDYIDPPGSIFQKVSNDFQKAN